MVELKQLDRSDYDLLGSIADGYIPPTESSIVVLATEGEKIVGRTMIVAVAHIEGTWVAPQARRGFIGKRLIDAIEKAARDAGIKTLLAYTDTEENGGYMKRLGYEKSPLVIWKKEV